MKIALFGGTFDPIHWGHLLVAESAREAYHLDQVLFIPSGIPPHKHRAVASAHDRLAMVRLAIRSNPAFKASDWEIRQRRTVYTYETLRHFQEVRPLRKLFFILGTDMLATIDLWRTGRALLDQCRFLAIERPGSPWSRLPAGVRRKARRIPSPAVPFASQDIRVRLRRGQSIRYQVPSPVERYIHQHRLYR